MTFRRKWITPGELTDAEIQHVVALAIGDHVLMAVRGRIVETMSQMVGGKMERNDDFLDDLFGELAVEIKRVADATYPRISFHDLEELRIQLMELPLDDIRADA